MDDAWQIRLPGWMIGRSGAVKSWFEDNREMMAAAGCSGVAFTFSVAPGLSVDENHYYNHDTGEW